MASGVCGTEMEIDVVGPPTGIQPGAASAIVRPEEEPQVTERLDRPADGEDDEEDVCRICRTPGNDESPLYYPCACSGSIKYVHQDCLLQWLNHSNARQCEVSPRLCLEAVAFVDKSFTVVSCSSCLRSGEDEGTQPAEMSRRPQCPLTACMRHCVDLARCSLHLQEVLHAHLKCPELGFRVAHSHVL